MSKINLTNDEYGYHTKSLKCKLTYEEYDSVTQKLYALAKEQNQPIIYPIRKYTGKSHRCHCSNILSNHGILLFFTEKKDAATGKWKWMVKALVNPRKVLDPNSSYLGIMSSREDAMEDFADRFTLLMRRIGLPDQLDQWHLVRLDLCVNLQCYQQKTAREYLRLLGKDSYRGRWTRILYTDPAICPEMEVEHKKTLRKECREKNKHYLQLENGTLAIVVYDKPKQMEWERLRRKGERLPKGVLRIEVRCGKQYLKKLRKEYGLHSTTELLDFMRVNSRELILKQLRRTLPTGRYGKLDRLCKVIEQSGYHAQVKEQLKWLCTTMQRKKRLEDGKKLMAETFGLSDNEIEYRMKQFKNLSVSPIPVTERFYLSELPSLLEVLEELEDGSSTFVIDENGKFRY